MRLRWTKKKNKTQKKTSKNALSDLAGAFPYFASLEEKIQ